MLLFNVTNVIRARGIPSPYAFLRKNGFSQRVAHNMATGNVSMLKLEHVEKLCLLLLCEPHDLMEWRPDKNKVYSDDNPLKMLKKSKNDTLQLMSKMPFSELKEVIKEVSEREK